jgi:hypothetical protein
MSSERMDFNHRKTEDGTVCSACPQCFAIVASGTSEVDLVSKEAQHHCDPFLVAYYAFFKKEPQSEPKLEQFSDGKKRRLRIS